MIEATSTKLRDGTWGARFERTADLNPPRRPGRGRDMLTPILLLTTILSSLGWYREWRRGRVRIRPADDAPLIPPEIDLPDPSWVPGVCIANPYTSSVYCEKCARAGEERVRLARWRGNRNQEHLAIRLAWEHTADTGHPCLVETVTSSMILPRKKGMAL